ncbi:ankyrin repeat domain-containing protein [Georgenia yuyongxinii]|uniref:Ankyrin repeat domain-containing protein n=1 Tax=Georgenia yuyongxinii TaxID=2589797 RepID=A0A5B8CAQ6_9MICO|nr:ankyrin repeat domain-containing protein [Georgenia yuyongxinii]QDC25196.1 ankyrin repeat domain-containing protein [Georgenia yuyongxinii]
MNTPGPDDAALEFAHRLFDHAREGGTAELVSAVDAGVPVNLTDAKGDTLLILAAYRQQAATVQALLARGADVERLNDRGQNALTCAVFKQDPEIAKLLLDAGADPDAGSPSARATAQFFNLPEMAALLAGGGRAPHDPVRS